MTRRSTRLAPLALLAFLTITAALPATAQQGSQGSGLELSLHGHLAPRYGEELRLAGTAYEVVGLAELKPLRSGDVVVRLRDYRQQRWTVVQEVTAQIDDRGRFTATLPVPEARFASAQLQVEVRGAGQTRTFDFGIAIQQPLGIDLRTDRNRYEPDETVHVWTRVHRLGSGAPVGGRGVAITITDPQGRPLLERTVRSSVAGVASLELPLPASAVDGAYAVRVRLDDSIAEAEAYGQFQVARRTVERLLVDATLDQRVVAPSARLTGTVRVRTPSGVPIANAAVVLNVEGRTTELLTDAEGVAPIRLQAPAYLSGDVAAQQVIVRVSHPAHGVLHVATSYLLSRVEWRVEATAENGGLVPEVDAEALLLVTDPRGEPIAAGSELVVTGAAVPRGTATLRVDRHGLAVLAMRVPDGAAGPLRGECGGRFATRVDVEVRPSTENARPSFARVCVPVSPDARVRARVRERVVEPGGTVVVALDRHPEVRGREVLVEAIAEGRVVAATHARGDEARLALPAQVAGVLQIRARPELAHDARHALDAPGGSQLGVGSTDAVLVRPRDAFGLSIETGRDVFRVRETAPLALRTTGSSPRAWAAIVARDLGCAARSRRRPRGPTPRRRRCSCARRSRRASRRTPSRTARRRSFSPTGATETKADTKTERCAIRWRCATRCCVGTRVRSRRSSSASSISAGTTRTCGAASWSIVAGASTSIRTRSPRCDASAPTRRTTSAVSRSRSRWCARPIRASRSTPRRGASRGSGSCGCSSRSRGSRTRTIRRRRARRRDSPPSVGSRASCSSACSGRVTSSIRGDVRSSCGPPRRRACSSASARRTGSSHRPVRTDDSAPATTCAIPSRGWCRRARPTRSRPARTA